MSQSLAGQMAESVGRWMEQALALALDQGPAGRADVPVGALVVDPGGTVIGQGRNSRESLADPTAHAEILALRQAGSRRGQWRLDGCTLVCTLEPCAMCAGAVVAARLDRLVFGAFDPKAGACGSVWDLVRDSAALHQPEVIAGVLEDRCAAALTAYFQAKR